MAKRELHAAVRLFVAGGDPVAVHVLVSAAAEILTVVGKSNGRITTRQMFLDRVRPEYRDLASGAMVASFNFMKHGRKDSSATIVFNPDEAEIVLFFSCVDYFQVFREASPEIMLFIAYMIEQKPKLLRNPDDNTFLAVRQSALELAGSEKLDKPAVARVLAKLDSPWT